MADLTPEGKDAMHYWPWIDQAARERWTTKDLWDQIKFVNQTSDTYMPRVTAQGVGELRRYAGMIRETGARYEQSPGDYTLDRRFIADAPWARDLNERNASPMYQVRYEHSVIRNGEQTTEWRTSMIYGHDFPATKQELEDALDQDATELAAKYGVAHAGIGAVQIMAV